MVLIRTHGIDKGSWYWQGLMVWTRPHGIDNTHGIDKDSWYRIGNPESHTFERAECYPYAGFFNQWCNFDPLDTFQAMHVFSLFILRASITCRTQVDLSRLNNSWLPWATTAKPCKFHFYSYPLPTNLAAQATSHSNKTKTRHKR